MTITAIIVNYNTSKLVENLLFNLEYEDLEKESIIIDNSGEIACQSNNFISNFRKAKIIGNEINKGFGKAVNQGVRQSKNRYVLLINPDIVFLTDCIANLYKTAFDFKAPIVGPRLGCLKTAI